MRGQDWTISFKLSTRESVPDRSALLQCARRSDVDLPQEMVASNKSLLSEKAIGASFKFSESRFSCIVDQNE